MSVKNLQIDTTPLASTASNDRSSFRIKDLVELNDFKTSYQSALATIGFIDLNAFFAQCEQIRLQLPDSAPVVCAQWQSLIAVSYPARKYGINRMDTIQSARSKCPNLIVAHAAAFKKGETHWQYITSLPDQTIYKVSLDPYRRESRKILKVLKEECDMVEKASVDESYLDLGRLVYAKLLSLFPQLQSLCDSSDHNDLLPTVPPSLPSDLYWVGSIYKTPEEESAGQHAEMLSSSSQREAAGVQPAPPAIKDWDDVCIAIGSQLLFHFRNQIYKELGYTTSGGVARNKRLAKLAGGFIKPDMQTIIRNSSVYRFLNNFELIDITGMGGKTGDAILSKFEVPGDTNSITFLRDNFTLQQLKQELRNDPQLAERVYDLVRGNYVEDLVLRTAVKSMMSRKNFMAQAFVSNLFDAYDWLKVFVGDLYSRLVELDDENMNLSMSQDESEREKGFIMRPKTIAIQLTTSAYSRLSRQTPMPVSRSLEKVRDSMSSLTFKVLAELLDTTNVSAMNDGKRPRNVKITDPPEELRKYKIMPLANISVVISNFVKTTDSNLIDSYVAGKDNGLSTQENIKKMFDEVNKEVAATKEKEQQQQEHSSASKSLNSSKKFDNEWVKKLFEDFNAKENESKTSRQESSPPPSVGTSSLTSSSDKAKATFKEDKEYIKKLFDKFESDQGSVKPEPRIAHNIDKGKRRDDLHDSTNILDTLKAGPRSKSASPCETPEVSASNNQLLNELIKNRHCSRCDTPVIDVFEHVDLHYAMDLSEKLNGSSDGPVGPSPTANEDPPTSRATSRAQTVSPKKSKNKKRKLGKGQTQLPF